MRFVLKPIIMYFMMAGEVSQVVIAALLLVDWAICHCEASLSGASSSL